jgi:hypothetical protein
MAAKMTPAQTVGGFAALMVFVWSTTAIVWVWPDASTWVLGATLVLIAIFLAFVYRAARKVPPPD